MEWKSMSYVNRRHCKSNGRLFRMQWEEMQAECKSTPKSTEATKDELQRDVAHTCSTKCSPGTKNRQMQANRREKHHAMHDEDTAPNEQEERTGSCKPSSFECKKAVASLIQGCKGSRASPSSAQASFTRWVCYRSESPSAIASRFAMQRSM